MRNTLLIIQRSKNFTPSIFSQEYTGQLYCISEKKKKKVNQQRRYGILETGYPTQERAKKNYQEDVKGMLLLCTRH